MNQLQVASHFLITTLFDLYTYVLLLRFLLQYLGMNYYNPLSQFVVKATSPVVVPLRKFIPGFKGIDFATLLVILLITLIKLTILSLIQFKNAPFIVGLLIWSIGDILKLTINVYFFAILVQVILSWIQPGPGHPINEILYRLTWPILKPFKKYIPLVAGMDITPIFAIITLQLVKILVADSIIHVGLALSFM